MAAGRQAAGLEASAVRHAVAEAVKARMGQDADVHIEELDFRTTPPPEGASLAATLESGARLGRQARFSLRWLPPSGARPLPVAAGFALAKVQVEVSHLRAGRDIALPPIPLRMLEALMRASPRVLAREEMERVVWGDAPPDSDALRSHLHLLRAAIDKPFDRPLLRTLRGLGWQISPHETSDDAPPP